MSNMVVQTNVLALNSHRNMKGIGVLQSRASSRLSSGFKINSAADDAAGLAISEKMRGQIRGLDMASKNAQDASSLIQTAEGGMQEIDNMVQRIRELVVYAANDTQDAGSQSGGSVTTYQGDRQKIQDEISSLMKEIDSMSERVEFNKKKLINGDFAEQETTTAQVIDTTASGYSNAVAASDALATSTKASDAADALKAKAQAEYDAAVKAYGTPMDPASAASAASDFISNVINTALSALGSAITAAGGSGAMTNDIVSDVIVGGKATALALDGTDTVSDVQGLVNAMTSALTGLAANGVDSTISLGAINIPSDIAASDYAQGNTSIAQALTALQNIVDSQSYKNVMNDLVKSHGGGDPLGKVRVDLASAALSDATTLASNAASAVTSDTAVAASATFDYKTETTTTGGEKLWFQVGANANQGWNLNIAAMNCQGLGLAVKGTKIGETGAIAGNGMDANDAKNTGVADPNSLINVLQFTGKDEAVTGGRTVTEQLNILDDALTRVTTERSKLGAAQNRLEYTMKSLDTTSENLSASESRIRDTDMAKEMMNLTKANVLNQAAISMLAQANQAPQSVLQLLQ